jgi:hypothetical protein
VVERAESTVRALVFGGERKKHITGKRRIADHRADSEIIVGAACAFL